jgi:hypothetical protein
MRNALIACGFLLCLLSSASADRALLELAADLPVPPPVSRPAAPPAEPSLLGYGDANKSCAEWTDGCRTCTRSASGDPMCPNIGPACQPKPVSCSRQQ